MESVGITNNLKTIIVYVFLKQPIMMDRNCSNGESKVTHVYYFTIMKLAVFLTLYCQSWR